MLAISRISSSFVGIANSKNIKHIQGTTYLDVWDRDLSDTIKQKITETFHRQDGKEFWMDS